MSLRIKCSLILLFTLNMFSIDLCANVKLKDLVSVKGVRDNPLIGYGLVVGLNGTGDGGGDLTRKSLERLFKKLGLNPKDELAMSNVAAVIVTANFPSFARVGKKVDVTISAIGGASSLAGGTLLVTPLKGGDGQIYAVASGALSIGGLERGSKFATNARIVGGAIVEKEIDINFSRKKALRLSLNNPDFTTAHRIEKTLNTELGGLFANARDSGTIDITLPLLYKNRVVEFLALVENFKITPSQKAKVVINEKTGTIAMGGDLKINPVAISHGDLVVEISKGGNDAEQGEAQVSTGTILNIEKGATIKSLVESLNTLKATPEDMISILQVLKENGAINATIEFI